MYTEPSSQVLTTEGEPAVIGPATRVYRTIIQIVLALVVAVPSAAALFDLPATVTAKISATMGALGILVSAIHNALNSYQAEDNERDSGQSTIVIVLCVLAIIALAIWIFDRR